MTKRITADDILSSLPGKSRGAVRRGRSKKKTYAQIHPNGSTVNSRWRTLAMDLTNVSVGTNGTVGSFNPESGKYLIHWSTGSSGYYDADSLES